MIELLNWHGIPLAERQKALDSLGLASASWRTYTQNVHQAYVKTARAGYEVTYTWMEKRLARIRVLMETHQSALLSCMETFNESSGTSAPALQALRDERAVTEEFIGEANLFLAQVAPKVKLRFADLLDEVLQLRDATWQLCR